MKLRPSRRWVLRGLGAVLAGLVVYLAVSAAQVWAASRQEDWHGAQAIVVLGSAEYDGTPSLDLRARLDHALALFDARLAPTIVVTGGSEPGDRYSEAQVSEAYLEHRGVPTSGVIWTVAGDTTWQSLDQAASVLRSLDIDRVLLVSDPYHSARIDDIAGDLGLDPYPSPTRTSPIHGLSAAPYYAKETLGVAVGRVIGFDHLPDLHQ